MKCTQCVGLAAAAMVVMVLLTGSARVEADKDSKITGGTFKYKREYPILRQLAATDIGYIGLLGPRDRRRRLLEELGEVADSLTPRLHGPAGLDIGGRGPASIALSIVAEVHQVLMQANGR